MNKGMRYWAAMAVFAFASFISFVQVNSYKADLFRLNTLWIVAGIVFAIVAIFCLVKVAKMSDD